MESTKGGSEPGASDLAEALDAATVVPPKYAALGFVCALGIAALAFHSFLTARHLTPADLEEVSAKVLGWTSALGTFEVSVEGRTDPFYVAGYTVEDNPAVLEAPGAEPPGSVIAVLVAKAPATTRQVFGLRSEKRVYLSAQDALASEEGNTRWALWAGWGATAGAIVLLGTYFLYPATFGLRPGPGR
ncbi:MAG: hypothetical protein FD126_359 [Elusimicrobia bacterium]|nr:MAG: hypothetical protein FD126_359 [Elusimicrobiota bacterium]